MIRFISKSKLDPSTHQGLSTFNHKIITTYLGHTQKGQLGINPLVIARWIIQWFGSEK